MNHEGREMKLQPSLSDRAISLWLSYRFAFVERVALGIARARHAKEYLAIEEPLVSVCIPTCNRAALLVERAIPSVLSQTYSNFEVVVVGDHCTHRTAEVVAQVNDPRIRFYNLPHRKRRYPPTVENHWLVGGAVPANKALDLARGEWIARLDDDDSWTPNHLETLLKAAQSGQYEFVSACYLEERFGERRVMNGHRAGGAYYTRRKGSGDVGSPNIGGVCTWLYRSCLRFFKYNPQCWRKSWNRVWDADLSMRIYAAGVKMGFVDQVLAYVLPRDGEDTIGLDAYRLYEEEKLVHYAFRD